MADPQRHSEDHPRRAHPIQPDRPGRGVGTERDTPDDRDTSNRTVERFFVFYNRQKGVHFMPIGRAGATAAKRLIAQGRRDFAQGASQRN